MWSFSCKLGIKRKFTLRLKYKIIPGNWIYVISIYKLNVKAFFILKYLHFKYPANGTFKIVNDIISNHKLNWKFPNIS